MQEKKASKPLTEKSVGVEEAGEIPSLTGESMEETHRALERTQNHLLRNQHQTGPICLRVVAEVTESQKRAEQTALFSLRPLPHIQSHNTTTWVTLPWPIPKALPLTMQKEALRQREK